MLCFHVLALSGSKILKKVNNKILSMIFYKII